MWRDYQQYILINHPNIFLFLLMTWTIRPKPEICWSSQECYFSPHPHNRCQAQVISKATALSPWLAIFTLSNAMNPLSVTGHYPIHRLTLDILYTKGQFLSLKLQEDQGLQTYLSQSSRPILRPGCPCSNRVLLYTTLGCLNFSSHWT